VFTGIGNFRYMVGLFDCLQYYLLQTVLTTLEASVLTPFFAKVQRGCITRPTNLPLSKDIKTISILKRLNDEDVCTSSIPFKSLTDKQ